MHTSNYTFHYGASFTYETSSFPAQGSTSGTKEGMKSSVVELLQHSFFWGKRIFGVQVML